MTKEEFVKESGFDCTWATRFVYLRETSIIHMEDAGRPSTAFDGASEPAERVCVATEDHQWSVYVKTYGRWIQETSSNMHSGGPLPFVAGSATDDDFWKTLRQGNG